MAEEEKKAPEEDKLFPDLEEYMDAAPNPKDTREGIEADFKEGVLEANELRARVGEIFKRRSIKSASADPAEMLQKKLLSFAKEVNKRVTKLHTDIVDFTDEENTDGMPDVRRDTDPT